MSVTACSLAAAVAAAFLVTSASTVAAAGSPDPRADQPVEITADEVVYDVRAKVYVAEGSVRIEQTDRSLDADWVVFNRETQRGIASGGVVLIDGDEKLEARFVEFNYSTQQGLVFRGRLDMGPDDFVIGAEKFVKTGKDTYTVHDVSFTTCRCPEADERLPWQVNAEDGDVEIGGYATTTNTSIDILGVPTLWLPWMFFPIKTERESGFLLPEIGYESQNGFSAALPYFWAARHNVNVTATPRYLTTRGFKPEVEVEAVYGEESETALYGTYLRDQDPSESYRAGATQKQRISGVNRWGLGVENDAYLPLGVRARSDVKLVSDNDFVRDFSDFDEFRRDRYLESSAFAFRHFTEDGSAAVVGGLAYADDRQNPDYEDRDEFVLQRAPTVAADWLPSSVPNAGGFTFAFGSDYTHFRAIERAEDALDLVPGQDFIASKDRFVDTGIGALPFADLPASIQNDPGLLDRIGYNNGRFDEGEPLDDEGHRLIVYPRVARALHLGGVTLQPEVGWQQTMYSTHAQNFADRGLFTARADASTQLVGGLDVPLLGNTTHVLEPQLGWALVERQSQSDNPLFIPATALPQTRLRQTSLDNVVLDGADRIDSANVLTLGLGNRFYTGSAVERRLAADLHASWGYDFAGESAGHLQEMILEGQTFSTSGFATRSILGYDMDREKIEEVLAEVQFPTLFNVPLVETFDLTAAYRYRRDIPLFYEFFPSVNAFKKFEQDFQHIDQVSLRARLRIDRSWAVGGGVTYSIENSILQQNVAFVEYTSRCRCWAARIDVNDSPTRGPQASFRIAILGLGDDQGSAFSQRALGTSMVD